MEYEEISFAVQMLYWGYTAFRATADGLLGMFR